MGKHSVMISRLIDGWQYRWEKGPGFTYLEERGFGTIAACLDHLYTVLATRLDESSKAFWELGQMKAAAQPEPLQVSMSSGVLPRVAAEGQKGVLKHEVTAIMGGLHAKKGTGDGVQEVDRQDDDLGGSGPSES